MNLVNLLYAFKGVIDKSFAVASGLALVVFIWGLAKFLFHISGDEKAIDEGKRVMKWGIIALFVLVSIWGIVTLIQTNIFPWGTHTPSPGGSNPLPTPGLYP